MKGGRPNPDAGRRRRRRLGAEPEILGEILHEVLRRTETEVLAPRQRIEAAWRRVVESRGIRGTRLGSWKSGTAVIEVESPPLCAELAQFRRAELTRALRDELDEGPAIATLRFRLGAFERRTKA